MTQAPSAFSIHHGKLRPRLKVDLMAIVAAVFFLTVYAAEMALIWHGASAMDPTTLMGFVT
jgi:hypothetical protein